VRLWVGVDQQHLLLQEGKTRAEVDGRRRFSGAAFLIGYRYLAHGELQPITKHASIYSSSIYNMKF